MTIKTRNSDKEVKTANRARKPSADQVAKAKTDDVQETSAVQTPMATPNPAVPNQQPEGVALEGLDRPVTGRGVFAVRTLGNAVAVESAFLEENGNVLRLPAVFPTRQYALEQIDELRNIVNGHFDQLDDLDKAPKAAS
ncbi:hypothetical protein [Fluviibacter phosphoraccumulans]|uniref:Uncharacterized protein n=1 Tax=Fluviibacter phosphoraccumulans TaxID=1751046 RepID=A0A7R6QYH0_9RHOO|nr:hypothetical protein [Fluviibacter phosphoraccumulans]BBU69767.1 hypothetical protein ICHIAU1_20500 [Fluviibacter phosphoraccumulans]BBU71050.1 hypothetical protein ICHIJ1_09690 [Fluviibacter phosphoraccumulans]